MAKLILLGSQIFARAVLKSIHEEIELSRQRAEMRNKMEAIFKTIPILFTIDDLDPEDMVSKYEEQKKYNPYLFGKSRSVESLIPPPVIKIDTKIIHDNLIIQKPKINNYINQRLMTNKKETEKLYIKKLSDFSPFNKKTDGKNKPPDITPTENQEKIIKLSNVEIIENKEPKLSIVKEETPKIDVKQEEVIKTAQIPEEIKLPPKKEKTKKRQIIFEDYASIEDKLTKYYPLNTLILEKVIDITGLVPLINEKNTKVVSKKKETKESKKEEPVKTKKAGKEVKKVLIKPKTFSKDLFSLPFNKNVVEMEQNIEKVKSKNLEVKKENEKPILKHPSLDSFTKNKNKRTFGDTSMPRTYDKKETLQVNFQNIRQKRIECESLLKSRKNDEKTGILSYANDEMRSKKIGVTFKSKSVPSVSKATVVKLKSTSVNKTLSMAEINNKKAFTAKTDINIKNKSVPNMKSNKYLNDIKDRVPNIKLDVENKTKEKSSNKEKVARNYNISTIKKKPKILKDREETKILISKSSDNLLGKQDSIISAIKPELKKTYSTPIFQQQKRNLLDEIMSSRNNRPVSEKLLKSNNPLDKIVSKHTTPKKADTLLNVLSKKTVNVSTSQKTEVKSKNEQNLSVVKNTDLLSKSNTSVNSLEEQEIIEEDESKDDNFVYIKNILKKAFKLSFSSKKVDSEDEPIKVKTVTQKENKDETLIEIKNELKPIDANKEIDLLDLKLIEQKPIKPKFSLNIVKSSGKMKNFRQNVDNYFNSSLNRSVVIEKSLEVHNSPRIISSPRLPIKQKETSVEEELERIFGMKPKNMKRLNLETKKSTGQIKSNINR